MVEELLFGTKETEPHLLQLILTKNKKKVETSINVTQAKKFVNILNTWINDQK